MSDDMLILESAFFVQFEKKKQFQFDRSKGWIKFKYISSAKTILQ